MAATQEHQEHKVASDDDARVWIEGVGEVERRLEITPARAGREFLSFRAYPFQQGQTIGGESAGDEMCIVLLSGAVTMEPPAKPGGSTGGRAFSRVAPMPSTCRRATPTG